MPGQVPVLTDERELLLAYVAQQRDGVRYAAFGLTDEQARLTPTAGPLSIGGLMHPRHRDGAELDSISSCNGSRLTGGAAAYADGFVLAPEPLAGRRIGRVRRRRRRDGTGGAGPVAR